ncbi:MAG TPA: hypothetical protein VF939_24295 [Puia sp.]
MRTPNLHIALASMIFFLAGPLLAQPSAPSHGRHPGHVLPASPPVVVKATVDKQKILIGQPIQLMLEATVPGDAPLSWPSLDSLPHFEWMEKGKVDSVSKPDGRTYRQYLTVTSFDSGAWAIPRLPFIAGNKKYFTDSVKIEVGFSKFDASKDYHDIKDIIDLPNPFAKWIGWIVAAATLLSLALVIWLVRKKKLLKLFSAVEQPRLSPYEEAMEQLELLEKQRLPENGSVKAYYTRLNDILRLFISRKLGIASLSETNEELIGQLRPLPVAPAQFDELTETLRMSDFVKFAKYQPGISDNEHNLKVIRSSVGLLNKIGEEANEQQEQIKK